MHGRDEKQKFLVETPEGKGSLGRHGRGCGDILKKTGK